MAPIKSALLRHLRVHQVFGANTDVGKTIFSTLLCRAAKKRAASDQIWYLKPVSTGPDGEADVLHIQRHAQHTTTQNFFQFGEAVSPHLAARNAARQVSDHEVLGQLASQLALNAEAGSGFALVETAGGPNSPGPSNTLQADLYRPLRLPVIYVADWHLGGISTSISGYESLKLRGYDIAGVAMFKETFYKNHEYLQAYFHEKALPFCAVDLPPMRVDGDDDVEAMTRYYDAVEQEDHTGDLGERGIIQFTGELALAHDTRIQRLSSMAEDGLQKIWWPFTQHKGMAATDITTIDSAHGDYFQTVDKTSTAVLRPNFDGSASWWTQGLGHANHDLTMAAAYAAGRYGHVMFASAINEPALTLATNLLNVVQHTPSAVGVEAGTRPSAAKPSSYRSRLSKVFYSDNGSTGIEVAVKMALKASSDRYGWDSREQDIQILGLQGSYHGDTIGCMDMSEPSTYNEKIHWYDGRGYWFPYPSVKMKAGVWTVEKAAIDPDGLAADTVLDDVQHAFDPKRDSSDDAVLYERYIRDTITRLTKQEKRKFGALVMEPLVLGAGGMVFVDPLFQRILARVVRASADLFSGRSHPSAQSPPNPSSDTDWAGLPIIHDEVFTGLYRLGHATPSTLIGVAPDIAVYAKLLTGGLVPLSCTLASQSIFDAFLAGGKSDALLHGHSYTAHPVGCSVADASIKLLTRLDADGSWDAFKRDWSPAAAATTSSAHIWSVWSKSFVARLSHATERIESVWALGSILSMTLRDPSGGGYTSTAALTLRGRLLEGRGRDWGIHSRVLGNVLYLMASQTSRAPDVRLWEGLVLEALDVEA